MKIVIVMNIVCVCVKTSAEEDDFQSLSKGGREGGEEGGRMCVFYDIKMLCMYNSIDGCTLL